MLVKYRVTDDPDVQLIAEEPALRNYDRLAGKIQHWLGLQYLYYPSTSRLPKHPWFQSADILQLFNTHGNFFAHTMLPTLSAAKATVWRLSDMWPLTGHCSYSQNCERWRTGCGQCPILDDYPPLTRDTTAYLWKVKEKTYAASKLTIVAPSRWMARLAAESPLLGRFPVKYIPNGIDLTDFRPIDKKAARQALGLPPEKRALLFHDPGVGGERKGRPMLREIVDRVLTTRPDTSVLIFGRGAAEWAGSKPNVFTMGEVLDLDRLRTVYSAADLFVFPTLAENLPNVALESMACGTPVVAFPVGGMPDIVIPRHSGELVSIKTAEAVATAVETLLPEDERLADMAINARKLMENEFSREKELAAFLALYGSLTGNG